MEIIINPSRNEWNSITQRTLLDTSQLDSICKDVFNGVSKLKDHAIRQYTHQFDKVEIDNLNVSEDEIAASVKAISNELKDAINLAKDNIWKFHKSQEILTKKISTTEGVECWQESRPIEKVGIYIPGGTAPLFSTVLMLAIPAKIAGCKEIVLCSPPDMDGKIANEILYAAHITGVDQVFRIGGIQAIAAMSMGTESIPKVNKLFGPGNQYVTAAKQFAGQMGVAIDLPAGPSEVLIMADETSEPTFLAADLLSQAEHGKDSQVILISTSQTLLNTVNKLIYKQMEDLPRKDIAAQSIQKSKLVCLPDKQICIDFINEYAPEHLILAVKDAEFFISKLINAGSVFMGHYTPESAGDYASGTNHTLPTNGHAKAYSGVNLDSFIKKITFQCISEKGLQNIGPAIELMAEAEGLHAHKNAISIRLKKIKSKK
jgi:histidinol dehydrogenase